MVLYNADDVDAAAVAQYYGRARSLPGAHLCGVSGVDPALRTIDFTDYHPLIHTPLQRPSNVVPPLRLKLLSAFPNRAGFLSRHLEGRDGFFPKEEKEILTGQR